jgi:hypothetical protein
MSNFFLKKYLDTVIHWTPMSLSICTCSYLEQNIILIYSWLDLFISYTLWIKVNKIDSFLFIKGLFVLLVA